MKVIQINATCGVGSTGKICTGIGQLMTAARIENYILYSYRTDGDPRGISCSSNRYLKIQALKSKVFGNYGFNSGKATQRMIDTLERTQPDIVHLHNIHGHDCNLEMLFTYFKGKRTKLLWTFHDCWAFTAYCPHFTMMKCEKWRSGCSDCIQRGEYSWLFDRSGHLYEKKKALLQGLDLTIVTPSRWLADLVKQSFLKCYPVYVINNGIDLDIFHPIESEFRIKYHLENKKIVLGVAFDWGKRKGLDVFATLADTLPQNYQIVLVGTNDRIDKQLPHNIISIHRTQNQQELAQIYSAADVFVNPTREENYPTVNMEALACGTPVLTFRTGGSPEIIDQTCGAVVTCDDVGMLEREIVRICTDNPYPETKCVNRAGQFDKNDRFKEYLDLYERVISRGN